MDAHQPKPDDALLTKFKGKWSEISVKIQKEVDRICALFPHNIEMDCRILSDASNPPLEVTEDMKGYHGMSSYTKKFLKKIFTNDRKVIYRGTGTSHSAAHDGPFGYNYFWQAGRLGRPIFELLDIDFISGAMGIGSVGQYPRTIYCLDANLGDDADFWSTDGMYGQDDCINERNFRNMLQMPSQPIYFQIWVWASHGLNAGWSSMWYGGKPNLTSHGFKDFWEGVVRLRVPKEPGFADRLGWAPEKYLDDEWLIENNWINRSELDRNYQYWKLYNEALNIPGPNKRIAALKDPIPMYNKYHYHHIDSKRAATMIDWHPEYMARGPLTRAGTHHPGRISHLYYGAQIVHLFARYLKEAVDLIDKHEKAGTLDTLREQALERLPMPEPDNPMCTMPGDMLGGGRSYSWLEVWPMQESRSIRKLVKSGSWEWMEWFGPGQGGRFDEGGSGDHDVHGSIHHENKNETDILVLEIDVPKFVGKNHEDGRVWLSLHPWNENVMNTTKIYVNGAKVDLEDLDTTDYSDLFNNNKAQLYKTEDLRPQIMPLGGINLVTLEAGKKHEIKFDGYVDLVRMWVL